MYASEACKLPSVHAKIPATSSVEEIVPEDSCIDGIRLSVTKTNRAIPDCSLFPISNLHPRGFAVSSTLPATSAYGIIAFAGDGYRFCARARALARHPLQMFVYPERWGDFPQTQRPVSRPASLAYYLLVTSIYFSNYIYFWDA